VEYRYGLQERGKSITTLEWSILNRTDFATLTYEKGVVKTFDLAN
jgi:WD40 repeat protein